MTDDVKLELKGCPFCGGASSRRSTDEAGNKWVVCDDCGGRAYEMDWNRRPNSSSPDEPWRCFQCGEVFTNREAAGGHFGIWPHHPPTCVERRTPEETERDRLRYIASAREHREYRLKSKLEDRLSAAIAELDWVAGQVGFATDDSIARRIDAFLKSVREAGEHDAALAEQGPPSNGGTPRADGHLAGPRGRRADHPAGPSPPSKGQAR